MAKRLKAWDQYVQEADREPVELPLPDGTVATIRMPSGGQLRRIARAERDGDQDQVILEMFGEDAGRKILALYEGAPATVLVNLSKDVMAAFGLGPEAAASSS